MFLLLSLMTLNLISSSNSNAKKRRLVSKGIKMKQMGESIIGNQPEKICLDAVKQNGYSFQEALKDLKKKKLMLNNF